MAAAQILLLVSFRIQGAAVYASPFPRTCCEILLQLNTETFAAIVALIVSPTRGKVVRPEGMTQNNLPISMLAALAYSCEATVSIYICLGIRHGVPLSASCSYVHRCVKCGPTEQECIMLMESLRFAMSWNDFERVLQHVYDIIPYCSIQTPTVLTYMNIMAALHICPRLHDKLIKSFQIGIRAKGLAENPVWSLDRSWTDLPLDDEQTNGFSDLMEYEAPWRHVLGSPISACRSGI
jgi:hypothetical protein